MQNINRNKKDKVAENWIINKKKTNYFAFSGNNYVLFGTKCLL